MMNAGKKNKATVGITRVDGKADEVTAADVAIPSEQSEKPEQYEQYAGIFTDSGPADLAIARKMENANK